MTGRWWIDNQGRRLHSGHLPVPNWYCLVEELGHRVFLALTVENDNQR